MKQEFPSLGLWGDLQSLIFTTMNIPVKAEYLPNLTTQGQTSSNNTQAILTDFEPDKSGSTASPIAENYYQYYPQGPYRFIDLLGNVPLQTMDVQVFWKDKNQQIHPVRLEPGTVFTLKMLFQKKNTYEEYNV